jgi:hypothetical protein
MNDQHAWPKVGDRVTLSMPHGPLRLVIREVILDPYGIPFARASDHTDAHRITRRIDAFTRGWPA